jgi:alcohol dehydrogenase (cytochrome c)
MRIKSLTFVISAGVLLMSTIVAAALYWHIGNWKSIPVNAVACRAQLYLQKARGRVAELSWTELWELTFPGRGFHCMEGASIEAGIRYSLEASAEDRSAGARIFRERCTVCHGIDGSGGTVGPSLTRPQYKHGDSDLAIYQVLRDGISGTAMPRAGLPPRELLQVMAYVKMLQTHSSTDHEPAAPRLAIHVSSERLRAAGTNPDEWLMYSGSYNGWRHAALGEITPANVSRLRIRWIKQFDNTGAIIEATPLVIDGVIFMVIEPGHVVALDDRTGDVIWEYKRPFPPDLPLIAGPVNRGLAVHGSIIFLGSLDGYLIAINANDGKVIWETLVGSPADGYSITGAPLVVDGSVVVGVAGADFGIRGFLAAYDVVSGRQQWKFETIPGPGEVGHESWENDAWRTGGGSTWNTGSYDPATDLLYWGVGNPAPSFSGDVRPGDNLFTDSVIALHASTGKLAWYFQFTPHDEHDWDSAQTPVLADLPIDGVVRKVICWPNRNGFYYVLDRVTGEFLAGVPFVQVDWAKGLTSVGRPILGDVAKVSTAGIRTRPGAGGGTLWQNPAFDPERGSIFVPATEGSSVFTKLPPDRVTRGQTGRFLGSGATEGEETITQVVALDAATGRPKWKFTSPSGRPSGLLSTEGGLVFGASGGVCFAVDADTGREVWRVSLGGDTESAPISFTVDGRQVIAVAAGHALFAFEL